MLAFTNPFKHVFGRYYELADQEYGININSRRVNKLRDADDTPDSRYMQEAAKAHEKSILEKEDRVRYVDYR